MLGLICSINGGRGLTTVNDLEVVEARDDEALVFCFSLDRLSRCSYAVVE